MVFLFASFSTKLSEKIRWEKSLVWFVHDVFIQDGYVPWTGNTDSTRFDKVTQSVYGMQEAESNEFRFEKTSSFLITISLQKWGPLAFKFAAFSWQTLMGGVSASWYIDSSTSFTGNLSTSYDKWVLYIKNLWGYSSYTLTTGESYTSSVEKFKSIKIIGWDEKIEKNTSHMQFTPWNWGDLDYGKLDMKF